MSDFFTQRWQGQVPMRTVFWRDLLAVGTLVNILVTFVALIAATRGAPGWVPVAIHFVPLPYNLFLCMAVHRAKPGSSVAGMVALGWLALVTLI